MLYDNRITSAKAIWGILQDSMNTASIRQKFLEQVQKEANCKNKNWAIIEVFKSGEIARLVNYLICFNADETALLVEYNYQMRQKSKNIDSLIFDGL